MELDYVTGLTGNVKWSIVIKVYFCDRAIKINEAINAKKTQVAELYRILYEEKMLKNSISSLCSADKWDDHSSMHLKPTA